MTDTVGVQQTDPAPANEPTGARSSPRTELLDRCQAWFASNGLRGHSLRQIASGVGTSHRMLIYHFGSREGLLAEIVGRTEAATREILTGFSSMDDPAEANRAFWAYLANPALAESERMFYEIYAEALHDRPWTDSFREAVINATAEPVEQLFAERGFNPEQAAIRSRLSIAATRGLLLDLLLTGDRELLAAAAELFAGLVTTPAESIPPQGVGQASAEH